MGAEKFYAFGSFRVDVEARALFYRGKRVTLTPKEFDVLELLVSHAGLLVKKDLLANELWNDGAVPSDAALAQTIYRLRRNLESKAQGEYIATVPGLGYQFVYPVELDSPRSKAHVLDFERFQKARYLLDARLKADDISEAIHLLNGVLEANPRNADALTALAQAYQIGAHYFNEDPNVAFPRSEDVANKALAIDPLQATAIGLLAESALFYRYEWSKAHELLVTAIRLDPSAIRPRWIQAFHHVYRGDVEGAKRRMTALLELHPSNYRLHATMGVIHYYAGEPEEAEPYLLDVLKLAPNDAFFSDFLAQVWSVRGRHRDALTLLEQLPDYKDQLAGTVGYLSAKVGNLSDALQCLRKLGGSGREVTASHANRALVLIGLNRLGDALVELERAFAEREPMMPALRAHPLYAPLRRERRFQELLAKVGLSG